MPVAIPVAVDLTLFLALLVAIGLLWVYRATVKQLLYLFADLFDVVRIPVPFHTLHPFGPLSHFLRRTANEVDHRLAALVLAIERPALRLWHGIAHEANLLGRLLGDLAETVERALQGFAVGTLPTKVAALERLLRAQVAGLEARVAHGAAAGTAALHRFEATVQGRFGRVERRLRIDARRLADIEKAFGLAIMAGIVIRVLGRLRLGWLRCRNVSRVGKRACAMDYDLLGSLLTDTLLVVGTFSLVTFSRELQGMTDDAAAGIRRITSKV